MNLNRDEILSLPDKTETEQINWFKTRGVLRQTGPARFINGLLDTPYESLADLAFRLRDEYVEQNGVYEWKLQIKQLLNAGIYEQYTWTAKAKPIHWIMAALLAKGEKQ